MLKLYKAKYARINMRYLLINVLNPEECDARDDAIIINARLKTIKLWPDIC